MKKPASGKMTGAVRRGRSPGMEVLCDTRFGEMAGSNSDFIDMTKVPQARALVREHEASLT